MGAIVFKCPVCGKPMEESESTFVCPNRHNFDRAASGYVNLLSSSKSGKIHGDSPEMIISRRNFLNAGYYRALREALYTEVTSVADDTSVFLDAGCGEGYYTNCFDAYFKSGLGVDISKDAVKRASKSAHNIKYCAASVFDLPVFDGIVNILTSVFAPYSAEEILRVVAPNGYVFAVVPGREHLWGLKQVLYEKPYENDEEGYALPGFELVKTTRVDDDITVVGEHITDLFKMTPYYWKTGKEASEKLLNMDKLHTKISFVIYCYKKV